MTQIRKPCLKALQLKVWLFDVDAFQHAFMMVRASRWGRGCRIIMVNAPNESWPKTARTVQHQDHSTSVASISVSSASAAALSLFTNPRTCRLRDHKDPVIRWEGPLDLPVKQDPLCNHQHLSARIIWNQTRHTHHPSGIKRSWNKGILFTGEPAAASSLHNPA